VPPLAKILRTRLQQMYSILILTHSDSKVSSSQAIVTTLLKNVPFSVKTTKKRVEKRRDRF